VPPTEVGASVAKTRKGVKSALSYEDDIRSLPAVSDIEPGTTDGGITWPELQPYGSFGYISSIQFTDANNGWAVGDRGVLATTDGGAHWATDWWGSTLYSVTFTDANHGWAVGDGGTILAYTNAAPAATTGSIAGTVTAVGGGVLSGVIVSLSTGASKTTASDGSYALSDLATGTCDVTFSKVGYLPTAQHGVMVSAGATSTVSPALAPSPPSPQTGLNVAYVSAPNAYKATWNDLSGGSPNSTLTVAVTSAAPGSTPPVGATVLASNATSSTFTVTPGTSVYFTIWRQNDTGYSTPVTQLVSCPAISTTTKLKSPSSVKKGKTLKLTGTVVGASGKVKVYLYRLVGKKWKTYAATTVSLKNGAYTYSFKPKYKGKWRFRANYLGSAPSYKSSWNSGYANTTVK